MTEPRAGQEAADTAARVMRAALLEAGRVTLADSVRSNGRTAIFDPPYDVEPTREDAELVVRARRIGHAAAGIDRDIIDGDRFYDAWSACRG